MNVLGRLNEYLLFMGIPGLLLISFVDSAAVPMAGGPDAVILLLSWRQPALFFFIALVATAGSTLGCLVLYQIGLKGGQKALARFGSRKKEWVERRMRDYGIWIIIAAVVAPPPFPTKLVILAAGVLRTGRLQLVSGVLIGRVMRYSAIAYLGARFGEDAARVIRENYLTVSLILVAGLLLVILIRTLRNRRIDSGVRKT
ncbi:MAG: DedA family protein [Acidobacteria bacterium]|nr:DedA family protein [Acidobacteriota bacterium]